MYNISGIERFIKAQSYGDPIPYKKALSEVQAGHKDTHWIWYVFPNVAGLGRSDRALYYSIKDLKEAKEYISNEYLRNNLVEITEAVLYNNEPSIVMVMGSHIDAVKLKSCMTLFAVAAPDISLFKAVLDKYFNSIPDFKTLNILGLPKTYTFL